MNTTNAVMLREMDKTQIYIISDWANKKREREFDVASHWQE